MALKNLKKLFREAAAEDKLFDQTLELLLRSRKLTSSNSVLSKKLGAQDRGFKIDLKKINEKLGSALADLEDLQTESQMSDR